MDEKIELNELSQLEHLRILRTTWSDEIPEKIIHSDSRIKSKARRNWFTGVVANVENALTEEEIKTPEQKMAAEELLTRFTSKEFIEQELTKKEDIQEANRLIDIILSDQG